MFPTPSLTSFMDDLSPELKQALQIKSICNNCNKEYIRMIGKDLYLKDHCSQDCYVAATTKCCGRCRRSYYEYPSHTETPSSYCSGCRKFNCKQCRKECQRDSLENFCGDGCKFKHDNPTCQQCHKQFKLSISNPGNKKYCSDTCQTIATHRDCLYCKTNFRFNPDEQPSYMTTSLMKTRMLYCSDKCRRICMWKPCAYKHCKKSFEYNPVENNNSDYCSNKCKEYSSLSPVGRLIDQSLL